MAFQKKMTTLIDESEVKALAANIKLEELRILKKLGEGQYGSVYLAKHPLY